MKKQHSCDAVRDMVFNYRRGELSELDAAMFEESLIECPDCASYAERVIDMLDAANEVEAEAFLDRPIDAAFSDSLFSSILAGIEQTDEVEGEHESPRQSVQLEGTLAGDQGEDDHVIEFPTRSPWLRVVAAAAVLCAVGVGAFVARDFIDPQDAPTDVAPVIADNTETKPVERENPPVEAFVADLSKLEQQDSATQAVKVFAHEGAQWRLEGKAPEHVLVLEQGTVLVEFLPENGETLKVISGETEISVVGTVFYVSNNKRKAEEPRVGVLTGKVRVKKQDATLTLEDGEEVAEGKQVRPITDEARQKSEALVDLDAHRKELAVLAAKTATPEPVVEPEPVVKPAPKKVRRTAPRVTVSSMHEDAREALEVHDYQRAVKTYEKILDRLPEGKPERVTVLFELSRIYTRNLDQRDKAIEHLRALVEQHPNDMAAPSARRKLCRLLGVEAGREPACNQLPFE